MKIEKEGEVAVVRLQGGKANSMDEAFLNRLIRLIDEVQSSGARAAVLTGYESFFSAGLSLPFLSRMEREKLKSFIGLFERAMRHVFECPLPVVAAINGHAIAGGCVLALQCDVRVMAEGSSKIGLNEVQLGIGLPSSVLESARLQLPPASLVPVALEGRLFSPSDAKRLGLVDEVVSSVELMAKAMERARELTLGSREAVAAIKRGIRRPALELMQQRGPQEAEVWLDAWFSEAAQSRIAKAVARLTGQD